MKLYSLACIGLLLAGALAACDTGVKLVGPAAEHCGTAPLFAVLPVAMSDIDIITVFGGVDGPGHTLPTPHAGIFLRTEGAAVSAPGAMQVTRLRRTTYVASPNRQGKTDYSVEFQICKEVSGWFGHLTTLASSIPVPAKDWKECETYSTALETIESCTAKPDGLLVTAGQSLGTSGLSIALGLMALDFGLMDSRVKHQYVAEWRMPDPSLRAVCAWDKFDASVTTMLYSKLGNRSRPSTVPAGEPRCGTMQVDIAGTAKGVWALPSETRPIAGNETAYLALVNYPYRPQDQLALSIGPASLSPGVAVVTRASSGRVNRPFEQVTNDGLIYCYGPDDAQAPGRFWFIQLTASNALSVRNVFGSPTNLCQASPTTWTMVGATSFVR